MEQMLITTKKDLTKLVSMMFLDMGFYEFQQTNNGLMITFDEKNPKSLQQFSYRFADWLYKDLFIEMGNKYFEGHPYKDNWNLWVKDPRFINAYCDQFYKYTIRKFIFLLMKEFDEFEFAQLDLSTILLEFNDLTKLRIELVEKHFKEGLHKEYISLHVKQESELYQKWNNF